MSGEAVCCRAVAAAHHLATLAAEAHCSAAVPAVCLPPAAASARRDCVMPIAFSSISAPCRRQIAALQQSVEQLRGALEAEKRSAAATHRRMVAENAELIARLREVQGSSSGTAGPSGCASRAGPSRHLGMNSSRASPSRACASTSCGGEGGGSGSPSRRPTSSRPASSTSYGTGQ